MDDRRARSPARRGRRVIVAQALFITTVTTKGHLSRVYRKLGISRRDQLAGALAGRLKDGGQHRGGPAQIIS